MTTSKKIQNMWAASRMFLPEHKEQVIRGNQHLNERSKPTLDDDKWNEINERLSIAFEMGCEVRLTLFADNEDQQVVGTVDKVDTFGRRIRIVGQWIPIGNILDAEVER